MIQEMEVAEKLTNYGVAGIMLLVCLFVIGFMFRTMMKFVTQSEQQCRADNAILNQRIDKLDNEFTRHRENDKTYRENQTERLLNVIDRNSDLIEGWLKGR